MSKHLFIIIIILSSNIYSVWSQYNYDQNWVLTSNILLNFKENTLKLDTLISPDKHYSPGIYSTTMSDFSGKLAFYSGGCQIINSDFTLMQNGDSLNLAPSGYCDRNDHIFNQCITILPYPDKSDTFLVFTLDITDPFPLEDTVHINSVPQHLLYHVVDMKSNNGSGAVASKNNIAIEDTLSRGYLQAVRHGNGRDWWLIVPEWNSNCYYSLLVTPTGIDSISKNCIGINYGDDDLGGFISFSPNGKFYARVSGEYTNIPDLQLFEFDRCNGTFYNPINLVFQDSFNYFTGLGFSPNNRFLYVSSKEYLWQFNIESANIQNSLQVVGQLLPENFGPGKGSLYYQRLGPDEVMYIASPGSHKYLSSINRPNEIGPSCQFKAHNILLPDSRYNYRGLPNHPNFRLGPLDGSSCDSLGINNIPIAKFRYEIDSLNEFKVNFINLSSFEPDIYEWSFGDSVESNLEDPSHGYLNSGIYEVCLTASNEYGVNKYCDSIPLFTTSIYHQVGENYISIYPNPVINRIYVEVSDSDKYYLELSMFDMVGGKIFSSTLTKGTSEFDVSDVPPGFYLIIINDKLANLFYTYSICVLTSK